MKDVTLPNCGNAFNCRREHKTNTEWKNRPGRLVKLKMCNINPGSHITLADLSFLIAYKLSVDKIFVAEFCFIFVKYHNYRMSCQGLSSFTQTNLNLYLTRLKAPSRVLFPTVDTVHLTNSQFNIQSFHLYLNFCFYNTMLHELRIQLIHIMFVLLFCFVNLYFVQFIEKGKVEGYFIEV